ncbi:ATP-binding cassette domain-containing protein [Lacisediminihabitans sp. H27-G8]|uniref:ATP-binding cassette domain-containing protein n=1 Tax=Lacisediminihabitans sp. H27-G8 TaxID=3111909 RepID=UPI0038FC4F68
MQTIKRTEVIFIGGRSGVGKTTVAAEISSLFAVEDIAHALIEGDNLDQAHPEPWRDGISLAEQNLAAMWRNYQAAGCSRLIFTNTVSVLQMPSLTAALGPDVSLTGVLLTASDSTATDRLAQREVGSGLEAAIKRSKVAAVELQLNAPAEVRQVSTDDREVRDIANELFALSGWS